MKLPGHVIWGVTEDDEGSMCLLRFQEVCILLAFTAPLMSVSVSQRCRPENNGVSFWVPRFEQKRQLMNQTMQITM